MGNQLPLLLYCKSICFGKYLYTSTKSKEATQRIHVKCVCRVSSTSSVAVCFCWNKRRRYLTHCKRLGSCGLYVLIAFKTESRSWSSKICSSCRYKSTLWTFCKMAGRLSSGGQTFSHSCFAKKRFGLPKHATSSRAIHAFHSSIWACPAYIWSGTWGQ